MFLVWHRVLTYQKSIWNQDTFHQFGRVFFTFGCAFKVIYLCFCAPNLKRLIIKHCHELFIFNHIMLFHLFFQHLLAIDGMWSAWKNVSECSPNANSNVWSLRQVRFCDNPRSQYNGRNCSSKDQSNRTVVCDAGTYSIKLAIKWSSQYFTNDLLVYFDMFILFYMKTKLAETTKTNRRLGGF